MHFSGENFLGPAGGSAPLTNQFEGCNLSVNGVIEVPGGYLPVRKIIPRMKMFVLTCIRDCALKGCFTTPSDFLPPNRYFNPNPKA